MRLLLGGVLRTTCLAATLAFCFAVEVLGFAATLVAAVAFGFHFVAAVNEVVLEELIVLLGGEDFFYLSEHFFALFGLGLLGGLLGFFAVGLSLLAVGGLLTLALGAEGIELGLLLGGEVKTLEGVGALLLSGGAAGLLAFGFAAFAAAIVVGGLGEGYAGGAEDEEGC